LSSELAVNFNVNYNIGNSAFFNNNITRFWTGGYNYTEKSKNGMGMGFNANVIVFVSKNLSVIPGISIDFGNQNYEFKRVESESETDVKDNYYFHLIKTDVKLNYDFIALRNGWKFGVIVGVGYNTVKTDSEISIGENKFWNLMAGIDIKFFQLKHIGFYISSIYNYPLKNKNFEYLTVQSGIIYKF
jgi:hypothetical protein